MVVKCFSTESMAALRQTHCHWPSIIIRNIQVSQKSFVPIRNSHKLNKHKYICIKNLFLFFSNYTFKCLKSLNYTQRNHMGSFRRVFKNVLYTRSWLNWWGLLKPRMTFKFFEKPGWALLGFPSVISLISMGKQGLGGDQKWRLLFSGF